MQVCETRGSLLSVYFDVNYEVKRRKIYLLFRVEVSVVSHNNRLLVKQT